MNVERRTFSLGQRTSMLNSEIFIVEYLASARSIRLLDTPAARNAF
jgi:hypothetical protein